MSTQISRRDFLGGSAGLTFAFTIGGNAIDRVGTAVAQTAYAPNAWLTIAADGIITIVSPASEMGQGTMTALPAIIADELDADWAKVRTVLPPAWEEKKWGNPGYRGNFQTSARNSVEIYFRPLRLAGAQARRVLLDAAASRWGVPVGELSTEPSVVVHRASGRRLTYGEIASFA
jgi:isoquinoline 1-oxidoreductase beta subunit